MKQRFSYIIGLLIAGCLLLLACVPGGGGVCGGAIQRGWSGPVVADDTIYLGSMGGEVLALNPSMRSDRYGFPSEGEWGFSFSGGGGGGFLGCVPAVTVGIYGTPAVEEGMVYIGASIDASNGQVYAFNSLMRIEGYAFPSEGEWTYPREGYIGSIVGSPVVDNGILYIGSSDGKLYAIDTEARKLNWDFETGDEIWATPLVHDGVVYIGSSDRKLYAINAENGDKRWEFETGGAIAAAPLIYNDTIYIGSFDSKFYAINLDGSEKWRFEEAGGWFWGKAVVYDDIIIVGCLDNKVYALAAESGAEAWPPYETGAAIRGDPALSGDLVIFGSEDGTVYALEAGSGGERWQRDLESPIRASLYAEDGVVYVHAANQVIYALETEDGILEWPFAYGE